MSTDGKKENANWNSHVAIFFNFFPYFTYVTCKGIFFIKHCSISPILYEESSLINFDGFLMKELS